MGTSGEVRRTERRSGTSRVWRDRWAAMAPWALAAGVALLLVVAFPTTEASPATLAFALMLVFFSAFAVHLWRSRSVDRPL